jgi:hypothetical protein
MKDAVKYLDLAANHFKHNDWNYTRLSHIKSIRYESEHDKNNKLLSRIKNSLGWLFGPTPDYVKYLDRGLVRQFKTRLGMTIFSLKREQHIPDGVLDDGGVITQWEETGEYLQFVQPSVGSLLAKFLKEDPENPHAKAIIAELERILERYNERILNGEVDGEPING